MKYVLIVLSIALMILVPNLISEHYAWTAKDIPASQKPGIADDTFAAVVISWAVVVSIILFFSGIQLFHQDQKYPKAVA